LSVIPEELGIHKSINSADIFMIIMVIIYVTKFVPTSINFPISLFFI